MPEKIGGVLLDDRHYPGVDLYSDGQSEDELLSIVQTCPEERYPQIIRERHSWEILYHLSDLRENIVEWLPLDRSMKVLEIGSGCGAVTGSLARRAGRVTCVELSRKRSLINAWRHREMENIDILLGNFTDVEPELPREYDYIFLIGVFEYARSYIAGDAPFAGFLRAVWAHLRPGGRMVIAIENKTGLKYWAGCQEDHLGRFFAGLEDYPEGGPVRTFTRDGLQRILTACGEEQYSFYYPYPDYKFMTTLYSDRRLPRVSELSDNLRNFDRDRMLLFDEKKVFDMLIREGKFEWFSNSFLVVTGPALETVYSRFSNDRARRFCIRTDIGEKPAPDGDRARYVRKYPCGPEAAAHIRSLADNYERFSERFAGSGLSVNRLRFFPEGPFVELEYLKDAVTLEELLDDALQRGDEGGFLTLMERYRSFLCWGAMAQAGTQTGAAHAGARGAPGEGIPGQAANFDMIFSNICVQGGDWTLIDYEWESDAVSPEDVMRRALYVFVTEAPRRRENGILSDFLRKEGIDEAAFARARAEERAFQREVLRESWGQRASITDLRHCIGNKAIPWQEYFARAQRKRVQVFWDFGEGYSPERSEYLYDAYLADDLILARVTCASGTAGVRFDPAEVPCLVRVRRVSIDGRPLSGEELQSCLSVNGTPSGDLQVWEGGTALFETADPNIHVRLDALGVTDTEGLCVELEAEIAWLSGEMLRDLRTVRRTGGHHWLRNGKKGCRPGL